MIIDKSIPVTYSNNKKYYIARGYPDLKQGSTISVRIEDLPDNCNKGVLCECCDCKETFKRGYQLVKRSIDKIGKTLCYNCSRKHIGKTMNRENIDKATRSRTGFAHPRFNPRKDEYSIYVSEVKKVTNRQPIDLLENSDKPRTICGVTGGYQLDHIMSIKEGFDKGIPALYIGSLVNLQFIPWEENNKKRAKSFQTVEVNKFFVKNTSTQRNRKGVNKYAI